MRVLKKLPLRSFRNVVVVAGAGMSADSGLPTFTDILAGWGAEEGTAVRALMETGVSPLGLFRRHPELAWPLYLSRLEACSSARIHNGYLALLEIARRIPGDCAVLTSNVDGLFPRAGFMLVHECHGQIARLQCRLPCHQKTWVPNVAEISKDLARGKFPSCPQCGEIARPNISWGDSSFVHAEGDERARIFASYVDEMQCQTLVIECGVSPGSGLRRFAEDRHRQREEVFLIRINLDAQEISGERHLSVAASAENALVGLCDAFLFDR